MSDPNLINYIGIAVAGGSVGIGGRIIFDWLKNRNNKGDFVKKSELYHQQDGSQIYLTEKSHEPLCEIARLKHQNYIADEMKDLKEGYLEGKFEGLAETIKQNNK